jgi:1-acyl-sn-glycerol-3-phosphate acyltransferase
VSEIEADAVPAPRSKPGPVYGVVRGVLRPLVRLAYRPRITGAERVPKSGPVILASNHLSFVDSVVIPVVAPRKVVFLAKEEYFTGTGPKGRATALFFRFIRAVPVQRDGSRDALAALAVAQGVLESGEAFGIYPEGTRSRDGRLHRGRTGVAWLALATRAPVLPVALEGTDRVQPIGRRGLRPAKLRVRFGPVIDPSGLAAKVDAGVLGPGRARRELTDEVMAAIAAMSPQPRAGGYNQAAASDGDISA